MRLIRLWPSYLQAAQQLGIVGTEAGRKVAETARALQLAASLPGPADATTLLPDDERGVSILTHVRRVRGCNLWIWYTATEEELTLFALTGVPPP